MYISLFFFIILTLYLTILKVVVYSPWTFSLTIIFFFYIKIADKNRLPNVYVCIFVCLHVFCLPENQP